MSDLWIEESEGVGGEALPIKKGFCCQFACRLGAGVAAELRLEKTPCHLVAAFLLCDPYAY
jgi:hypothetical protein